MATNRLTQKELRAPDAFQRAGGEARRWLEQRRTLVFVGAGALVVLALAAAILSSLAARREQQAARALGAALKTLDRPVGEAIPGDEQKPYVTQSEKDRALVQAVTPVRADYKKTVSATTGALPLGDAELRLSRPDGALPLLEDFVAKSPSSQILRVSGLESQGYAWEAKGQLDRALEAFERMSREDGGGFLAGMGLYHRARVLLLMGKKLEAADAFQEVVSAKPGTAAAALAEDRLGLLAAEGVRPKPMATVGTDAG